MPDLSVFRMEQLTKETTPKHPNRNAQYQSFSDWLRGSDLALSLNGEQFIGADALKNNVVFTK